MTPASNRDGIIAENADSEFYTVICCTASRQVQSTEISECSYIQGAGDDSESWSHGLTPEIFWKRKDELLKAPEQALPSLIKELVSGDEQCHDNVNGVTLVTGTKNIYISNSIASATREYMNGIIVCNNAPVSENHDKGKDTRDTSCLPVLRLNCGTGKLGSRALRAELPRVLPFINSLGSHTEVPRILFVCSTGKDISVGVALVVLCVFFDDSCKFT